ncbi:MAG: hypothetical protein P4L56_06780 [Candidatus Sulfopaludibacter sp.]|nr:hypothetical protein [Candidatus Sulfopaludibacter sp.]
MSPRLACLLFLASAPALADSWPGVLVDSKCYASEERNVNPADPTSTADRDMNLEVRYCSPSAKTKAFAVVRQDWSSLTFDAAGDAKAAELVRKVGRKPYFSVVVTGERTKDTINVTSITESK